jgi:hypothetical protein
VRSGLPSGRPVGIKVPDDDTAPQEKSMGSFHSPKRYGNKTRIDLNQSYQVAYWKDRFGVTEEELSEAVHAAGALARKVEKYLKAKVER